MALQKCLVVYCNGALHKRHFEHERAQNNSKCRIYGSAKKTTGTGVYHASLMVVAGRVISDEPMMGESVNG